MLEKSFSVLDKCILILMNTELKTILMMLLFLEQKVFVHSHLKKLLRSLNNIQTRNLYGHKKNQRMQVLTHMSSQDSEIFKSSQVKKAKTLKSSMLVDLFQPPLQLVLVKYITNSSTNQSKKHLYEINDFKLLL